MTNECTRRACSLHDQIWIYYSLINGGQFCNTYQIIYQLWSPCCGPCRDYNSSKSKGWIVKLVFILSVLTKLTNKMLELHHIFSTIDCDILCYKPLERITRNITENFKNMYFSTVEVHMSVKKWHFILNICLICIVSLKVEMGGIPQHGYWPACV